MAVVLSISSQVVRGHVGNSAVVPALRVFGHEVWPVPTVILSNHPGHGGTAGVPVEAGDIKAMIGQLRTHGWLASCDAVLTGYFHDAEQVRVAAETVRTLKVENPDLLYCCDPVLGDYPGGLYVAKEIASAVRDTLIPLADIAVPNQFELEWLTGLKAGDADSALVAARQLRLADVVVTSVPQAGGRLANIWVSGEEAVSSAAERLPDVPHGIGDLTTALVLARRLAQDPPANALGLVTAVGQHVLTASRGRDELDLVAGLRGVDTIAPAKTTELAHGGG